MGPYKTSPHTKRVVKKGRLNEASPVLGLEEARTLPLFPAPAAMQSPMLTPAEPPLPTMPQPAVTKSTVGKHLAYLEALLDSVLATVVTIQAANKPFEMSKRTQESLALVNQHLAVHSQLSATPGSVLPATGHTATKKSYADATKAQHSTKAIHTPRSSPASPTPKRTTGKPHKKSTPLLLSPHCTVARSPCPPHSHLAQSLRFVFG